MAISIGSPDRYSALEGPSSVDSIRFMWWKQFLYPMIYHSSVDFTGFTPSASDIARAESGYDYAEVWRRNTADFAPAPRPPLPADTDGGVYSTSYLDAFLDRDPEVLGDDYLAIGDIRGFITRDEFMGMSKTSAQNVVALITRRMNYVVEFWV